MALFEAELYLDIPPDYEEGPEDGILIASGFTLEEIPDPND